MLKYDLDPSNWENLAKQVIVNFYGRSGVGRGNYDRLIDDRELKNLVGFALNCFQNADLPDPDNWSQEEQKIAENGIKRYDFDDDGQDCKVTKAIKASCKNDDRNYICVLPVIYKNDLGIFFTPLFRARQNIEDKPHFIDAKGRVYDSFGDWEHHNSLPEACEYIYPTNGVLNGSNASKKLKTNENGVNKLLGTAISLCENFGGPLGSVISSPLAAVAPICEIYDRASHGESINPFASDEAAGLWFSTTVKISGPFGKMAQTLGFAGKLTAEKKEVKSEKVSQKSLSSMREILDEDEDKEIENATLVLSEAKSLLENPMTMKDMMKLIKYYSKTPANCLRISILLGFYMNTKFFYFNTTKLNLISNLYKTARNINETKNFRVTNNLEIVVGPLKVSMKLLESFTCDEIVRFVSGLQEIKCENAGESQLLREIIEDTSKFFKTFDDFMRVMMMERKTIFNKNNLNEMVHGEDEEEKNKAPNVEELKIYITQDHKTILNYQNLEYEVPKLGEKNPQSWLSVLKILERRLVVFTKILNAIRCHEFNAITSGIIFQFTKHAAEMKNNLTTVQEAVEVFPMLMYVYKVLRENFIPFSITQCLAGRPLFRIGYGLKLSLNDLYHILQNDESSFIEILQQICSLNREENEKLSEIFWNFRNDQALFRWIRYSFNQKFFKLLIEMRDDVLSDEFKSNVQLFIPDDVQHTNGLLLITSGVYGLLISLHVLHEVDKEERLAMMKSFENLCAREELMNVIGRVFKDKNL